jgi:hypothetical protein
MLGITDEQNRGGFIPGGAVDRGADW